MSGFNELNASLQEVANIKQGMKSPSRVTRFEVPDVKALHQFARVLVHSANKPAAPRHPAQQSFFSFFAPLSDQFVSQTDGFGDMGKTVFKAFFDCFSFFQHKTGHFQYEQSGGHRIQASVPAGKLREYPAIRKSVFHS
ncbi:hypothetical protein [Nitrosomonas sp.]|uniref:hypothetical protein n=1 Tax=Nitrosomonas sp. TaxID=42353 RepID=UPI0025ED0437|nr:hypothetical protein [Nitrosomonas sp.]MCC6916992.1 hypothetical protein [Nitrosomonas sp.]